MFLLLYYLLYLQSHTDITVKIMICFLNRLEPQELSMYSAADMSHKSLSQSLQALIFAVLPQKVYFKKGCLPVAMRELKQVLGKQKAFVVTDRFLFQSGTIHCITDQLHELGIAYQIFSDVEPDPTLACAKRGAEEMRAFAPDVIIALGGGSAMDAAKIMWVMYEHPEADFMDMAMRFLDIRKRVYTFPTMGEKAYFIAVPTSSGTGSEVTPFAVITDEKTGVKYPLADYALLPNMAIVDTDLMMTQPKGLTAASGIDALVHSLEAYASVMATDFTDGLALRAIQNIFTYLPACFLLYATAGTSRPSSPLPAAYVLPDHPWATD